MICRCSEAKIADNDNMSIPQSVKFASFASHQWHFVLKLTIKVRFKMFRTAQIKDSSAITCSQTNAIETIQQCREHFELPILDF